MSKLVQILLLSVAGVLFGPIAGCGARPSGSNRVMIPQGQYAMAFDATREALRDASYRLDRVDAQQGIITTRPKPARGLAAAWEGDQSSFQEELEDFAHRQQRIVRVLFVQAETVDAAEPLQATAEHDAVAIVEVGVERVMMPGLRPQSRAIGLTNITTDPTQAARGVGPGLAYSIRQDDALAGKLARAIAARMDAVLRRVQANPPTVAAGFSTEPAR
jgi:hypothetical protein